MKIKLSLENLYTQDLRRITNENPELAKQIKALDLGWYQIVDKTEDDEADILIYDTIGGSWLFGGVEPAEFARELREITASKINVRINSPGGRVFDGITIYNAIVRHPAEIHVHVDGLAASIASVIAMAGDRVTMMKGSQMMIHDALGIAIGNAADHREYADFLERQSENLTTIYAERTGKDEKEIRQMMLDETWMFASEAVDLGFADDVYSKSKEEEDDEPDEEEETEEATAENQLKVQALMSRKHTVKAMGYKYADRRNAPAPGSSKKTDDQKSFVASLINSM